MKSKSKETVKIDRKKESIGLRKHVYWKRKENKMKWRQMSDWFECQKARFRCKYEAFTRYVCFSLHRTKKNRAKEEKSHKLGCNDYQTKNSIHMKRVHNFGMHQKKGTIKVQQLRDNENTSHFEDLMTSLMHMWSHFFGTTNEKKNHFESKKVVARVRSICHWWQQRIKKKSCSVRLQKFREKKMKKRG